METNTPSFKKMPPSRRTAYQFPVYRWIGWLAVAGFAIGLIAMFFIAGMFGIPAPLGWASIVILFTLGALLLDRPKLLLTCMLFYFMLMPSNRLFGLLGLPLPGFLDELFFLPFIAVIAMNWVQRRQLKEATFFPLLFCLLAGLSWYVNRPPLFAAVRVTLIMMKFYIIWYYCRLTCTFESEQQLSRWVWGYIVYVAVQFLYNILWQQAPWARIHPDRSGGVLGPDSMGGAHIVGYLSVFALLLMAGWWVSRGNRVRPRQKLGVVLLALIISYDFIFMTDTKHGLVLFPFAFIPFLLHPKFSIRIRLGLLAAAAVFITATVVYFQMALGGNKFQAFVESFKESPKGEMLYAVTVDFPHLVHYPLLGAGPGNFASGQAVEGRAPLARRYIIPYVDQRRRMGYFGMSGTLISSSILGIPQTDLFVLMGEFGWLDAIVYYSFLIWVIVKLWRKSMKLPLNYLPAGYLLSLCCCLIFLIFVTTLISVATVGVLSFPLWILVARMWDMELESGAPSE